MNNHYFIIRTSCMETFKKKVSISSFDLIQLKIAITDFPLITIAKCGKVKSIGTKRY